MDQEVGRDGQQDQAWPWAEDGTQIVLVLVGLIASGKSTFAKALEEHIPHFRRCNQDDLGSRTAVERLARQTLQGGRSVCIDRTNFDATQREHWIRIGHELGTRIWCLVFDTPLNVCKERLQYRTDHPTILSAQQGEEVLYRFANLYSPPTAEEGFDRIYTLKPQEYPSPSYTRNELLALLVQIENSPPPVVASDQLGIRPYLLTGDKCMSQSGADLNHNNVSRRPVTSRASAWAGAGRSRGSAQPDSRRGFRGHGFQEWRGYASQYGRIEQRGASTPSTTPSSAGFKPSFGYRGHGNKSNAFPRRSDNSSSWRRDSSNNGQQLPCDGQVQPRFGSGTSSSLLTSPERQSQSNRIAPGDAHRPDVAYGEDVSPHPFTTD